MNKADLKLRILETGIAKHQSVVDDYREQIRELRESEVAVNDGQFDHSQSAYNDETNMRINEMANQLNFALEELNLLNTIRVELPLHRFIGFGTVIKTDKRNFFVSASIEDFQVFRTHYFGLSMKAPIFEEMRGKKKGESFTFKGITYTIKDVF